MDDLKNKSPENDKNSLDVNVTRLVTAIIVGFVLFLIVKYVLK